MFKKRRSCGCLSILIVILLLAIWIGSTSNKSDHILISPADSPESPASAIPASEISPAKSEAASTPTLEPEPTATIPKADSTYQELVNVLDEDTVLSVEISNRSLTIHTALDRSNLETFFEDIGLIHGIVVREDPDVDSVILMDITGQQIIMPYQDMVRHYEHSIDWEQFRASWEVINP